MIKQFIIGNWKYFLKYSIVGVSGTLIDIAGFAALLKFTSLNRFAAATISFIAAVANNFTWNKLWTFKDHQQNVSSQFAKFLLVSTGGLLLNLAFLWLFTRLIALLIDTDISQLSVLLSTLAKLGASATVLVYNFSMNRFWTFKPAQTKTQA